MIDFNDYEKWIYQFLYYHNCIHDESALYVYKNKDQEYGKQCGTYHQYLINIKQLPKIIVTQNDIIEHFYTPFTIQDREYIIQTLIGSDTTTWITTKEGAYIGE